MRTELMKSRVEKGLVKAGYTEIEANHLILKYWELAEYLKLTNDKIRYMQVNG
jgi:hypothetical protein